MRTFIALEPDLKSFEKLSSFAKSFLPFSILKKLKTVSKENIHLTLFFLGDYFNEQGIELLSNSIRSLNYTPIDFRCEGIGFFPNEINPKVIWLKPDESAIKKIEQVYLNVKNILSVYNFSNDEKFVPHITLARVKGILTKKDIEIIKNFSIDSKMCFEKLVLFKSTLTPKGPIYERIVEV